MSPLEFAASLIAYCYATRASVTSWGRTEKRNRLVGGHAESQHLQWLGADVAYDEIPAADFRQKVAARFGLMVVVESDHDHLQPRRTA